MSLSHVVSCLMPVPVVICYDLRGPTGLTTGPIHCSKAQSRNGGALGTKGLLAVWWGVQCAGPGLGFHRQLWSKVPIPIGKPGGSHLQQPAVARAGPCSSQLWPGQLCTDVGSLGAGPRSSQLWLVQLQYWCVCMMDPRLKHHTLQPLTTAATRAALHWNYSPGGSKGSFVCLFQMNECGHCMYVSNCSRLNVWAYYVLHFLVIA